MSLKSISPVYRGPTGPRPTQLIFYDDQLSETIYSLGLILPANKDQYDVAN